MAAAITRKNRFLEFVAIQKSQQDVRHFSGGINNRLSAINAVIAAPACIGHFTNTATGKPSAPDPG
jgi:hypothetical protein